jgi:hypothetical protein
MYRTVHVSCRPLPDVTAVLADIRPASNPFLRSRQARVHHPMRVMITAPGAFTFEGDKWPKMENAKPVNERLAN